MRILWHSQAPWTAGGYGNQTALFAPRIAALGHDVVVSAYYGLQGGAITWGEVPVWPSSVKDDTLATYVRIHVRDDGLVLTLLDVFALNTPRLREHRTAAWVPVDHDPIPPMTEMKLRGYGMRPIAMSRFGERMLSEAGLDPLYVPHAVDTTVFQPRDRGDARKLLGIPETAFMVGMVAANAGTSPIRKAFPEALLAFREFRHKHPDVVLYLHTELLGGVGHVGMDLMHYMRQIGMPEGSVQAIDQDAYTLGLPQRHLADVYSAMDVLLNPAYGEGFGIPIVEAQACSTPVIVNGFSSMPELCGSGWQCVGEPYWNEAFQSWMQRPDVDSIVDCLERAYTDCSPKLRQKARRFALDYDADRVTAECWKPVLDELT